MKTKRQMKILELIRKNDIETQEELSSYLIAEGYPVTQATVSRDIRALKLTKIAMENGRKKYAALADGGEDYSSKYARVLREGYLTMDIAQNLLVIRTVAGMASAVCTAIDAMQMYEIVGSIAGDDTILCATRSAEDAESARMRILGIVNN